MTSSIKLEEKKGGGGERRGVGEQRGNWDRDSMGTVQCRWSRREQNAQAKPRSRCWWGSKPRQLQTVRQRGGLLPPAMDLWATGAFALTSMLPVLRDHWAQASYSATVWLRCLGPNPSPSNLFARRQAWWWPRFLWLIKTDCCVSPHIGGQFITQKNEVEGLKLSWWESNELASLWLALLFFISWF
jgi:hypothetical protein